LQVALAEVLAELFEGLNLLVAGHARDDVTGKAAGEEASSLGS
jgi:hypothetical protein